MADFNSSDIEMEPDDAPDPFAHYGARSIEAMFEERFEDRIKTKKRMANLKDTLGAPMTVRLRALWMRRFEAYMTQVRGLSPEQVPSGDDIARFVESIASKVVPRALGGNKPVPNLGNIQNGVRALCSGLIFKFNFSLSRQECRRLDTLLDSLVKEGKLIKGRWRKRERVGFYILRILGQAWFTKSLTEGCLSWDIIISRFLSVSLVAATASRAGDITRSQGYTGPQYVRWEHIELVLVGEHDDEPRIEDMVAQITIAYEKGSKGIRNRNKVVTVKALDDVQNNTVCPIKLLLIHALRTGHVAHTSIESLLRSLQASPGRTVQWVKQSDPVVPAIMNQLALLDFSKPALAQQVLVTVRAAGLMAGILTPLQAHDIRAGVSRDVAKLPADAIKGVASQAVAKVLGHATKSISHGITDDYIGGVDTAVNAVVAENAKADTFGPKIAKEAFVKRRVPPAEVEEFCEEHGLEYSLIKDRRKAMYRIRAQELEQWTQERRAVLARPAPQAAAAAIAIPSRRRQQPEAPIDYGRPLAERSPNVPPTKRPRKNNNEKKGAGDLDAVRTGVLQQQQQPAPPTTTLLASKPYASRPDALIDPRLRGSVPDAPAYDGDEEPGDLLESTPVDPASVSSLESLICGSGSTDDDDDDDDDDGGDEEEAGGGSSHAQMLEDHIQDHIVNNALDEVIAENGGPSSRAKPCDDPASVLGLPGMQFIDHFAKINVVRNKTLNSMSVSRLEESLPKHVAMGNSRDKPTLFLIRCPNAHLGCDYANTSQDLVVSHTGACNHLLQQKLPEAAFEKVDRPFRCDRDGCTTAFRSQVDLNRHIKDLHDFTPKKCELPDCPRPDVVVWTSRSAYNAHTREEHDKDWTPSKCGVPDCTHTTVFLTRKTYGSHLTRIHHLRGAEKEKYLPARTMPFAARRCPIEGCKLQTVYKIRALLKRHLVKGHKFEEGDELESLLEG
ncbi:hypothetical protein SLS64_005454 [Diaporthe eres]|uniref:C2H2-type domain-containing protein n=1 Tax=Diaporthe eres TaxID=83184 RepID=A0ABR1PDG0_DIAER